MSSKFNALRYATIFLLVAVFSILISPSGNANESYGSTSVVSNNKELIIQVRGLSIKNTADLRSDIEDNPGVTFKGICYQNSVLMYVIDRDLLPDNTFIDAAMANYNLTYVIKEGSIIQVMEACPDTEIEPANETE